MMKNRFFPTLNSSTVLRTSLLALLLASCAPAAIATEKPAMPVVIEPSATAFLPANQPALPASTDAAILPTEGISPTPFPIATSRGPNLEATDPRTVSLASGGIQFVEFFRFT
jgi:hypothetical protein